jgi:hypothetical protein
MKAGKAFAVVGGRYAAFYRAQLKEQGAPREPVAVMASSG